MSSGTESDSGSSTSSTPESVHEEHVKVVEQSGTVSEEPSGRGHRKKFVKRNDDSLMAEKERKVTEKKMVSKKSKKKNKSKKELEVGLKDAKRSAAERDAAVASAKLIADLAASKPGSSKVPDNVMDAEYWRKKAEMLEKQIQANNQATVFKIDVSDKDSGNYKEDDMDMDMNIPEEHEENEKKKVDNKHTGNKNRNVTTEELVQKLSNPEVQLQYQKDDAGVVEISKGSGIYAKKTVADSIEVSARSHTAAARAYLEAVFTEEALLHCSLMGKKAKGPNGQPTVVRPALNPSALKAVLKAAKALAKENDWPTKDKDKVKKELSTKQSELRHPKFTVKPKKKRGRQDSSSDSD